jgi:hypothetical protein
LLIITDVALIIYQWFFNARVSLDLTNDFLAMLVTKYKAILVSSDDRFLKALKNTDELLLGGVSDIPSFQNFMLPKI